MRLRNEVQMQEEAMRAAERAMTASLEGLGKLREDCEATRAGKLSVLLCDAVTVWLYKYGMRWCARLRPHMHLHIF